MYYPVGSTDQSLSLNLLMKSLTPPTTLGEFRHPSAAIPAAEAFSLVKQPSEKWRHTYLTKADFQMSH